MKNKGFTLVELLLVMTVIGVIAALVLPYLINSIGTKKIGPTVGKVVEQIELGNQNFIQAQNDLSADTGEYGDKLSDFDNLSTLISNEGLPTYWNSHKSGTVYKFSKIGNDDLTLTISGNDFIIDYNGSDNPNTEGVDQFKFALNDDGSLSPSGSGAKQLVKDEYKFIKRHCNKNYK